MYILPLLVCVLFTLSTASEEGFRLSPYSNEKNFQVKPPSKDCEIKQLEGNIMTEIKKFIVSSLRDNCERYNLPKDILYHTVDGLRGHYKKHHWFGAVNAEYLTVKVPYIRVVLLNKTLVIFGVEAKE